MTAGLEGGGCRGLTSTTKPTKHPRPAKTRRVMQGHTCAVLALLLSLTDSLIGASERCPSVCRCDPALLEAACSSAGLTFLPTDLPSTLQQLDLSHNSLAFHDNSSSVKLALPHLLTLNLSSNLISGWHFLRDISAENLLTLDIGYNQLGILPEVSTSFPRLQQLHMQHNKLSAITLSVLSETKTLHFADLSDNVIDTVDVLHSTNTNLSHLTSLDLSRNMLSGLSLAGWNSLLDVRVLNLSSNNLKYIIPGASHNNTTAAQPLQSNYSSRPTVSSLSHANDTSSFMYNAHENGVAARSYLVETIDLSHNELRLLHTKTFQHQKNLKDLRLDANKISAIDPACFEDLHRLESLILNENPISYIPTRAFASCSNMQYLEISHMPNLTDMHFDAFVGLNNLHELIITDYSLLQYLHAWTLNPLSSLRVLDMRSCAVDTIYPDLLANTSALETFYMSGNPLHCGCDSKWVFEWITKFSNTQPKFHAPETIKCASPSEVENQAISDLAGFNFTCSPARIVNYTAYEDAMFKVGSPALIDCVAEGDPQPQITWMTPQQHMVLYHPAYVNWLRPGPHHHVFHANHPWHDNEDKYTHNVPHSHRIHVLNNGSLYVDYMLRNDAGAYTCRVHNPLGNETVVIHVRLDYSFFKWNVIVSIAVGHACALGFFCIAVLTAVLRYIAYFCSPEQREKRRGIREILASLDQYRHDKFDRFSQYKSEKIDQLSQYKSEKFDKISAYKTEKFDKLSAFKSAKFDQLAQYKMAKFDKLRNYKSLSFSTLVHYVKSMREYYIGQMVRIKENCTQQSEKLRESYATKTCAFKDYRSHKLDTLRENYAQQVMKIKEYGSSQMTRLREQYKTQQNHILKLIELMGIGNCMHIVEAECMRTESMLFDPDELNFDFDTHPVHVPPYFCDDNESVYETAGSNIDVSAPTKRKKRQTANDDNEATPRQGPNAQTDNSKKSSKAPDGKSHHCHRHHRRQRRCRHKRPINLPSFDDPDEVNEKQIKRKRRRFKERRPPVQHDDDTTAPDTPPELRSSSAIRATVHDTLHPSSDYDTCSGYPSREVTPAAETRHRPDTADAAGQNVIDIDPTSTHPEGENDQTMDLSPVHRAASPASTPSTPTLTEDHVIVMDPDSAEAQVSDHDNLHTESTV